MSVNCYITKKKYPNDGVDDITEIFFGLSCCDKFENYYIDPIYIYLHYKDYVYSFEVKKDTINAIFDVNNARIATEGIDFYKFFLNEFLLRTLLIVYSFKKKYYSVKQLTNELITAYNTMIKQSRSIFRKQLYDINSPDSYKAYNGETGTYRIFFDYLRAYQSINKNMTMQLCMKQLLSNLSTMKKKVGSYILEKVLQNVKWIPKGFFSKPSETNEFYEQQVRSFLSRSAQSGGKKTQYVRLKSNNRRCKVHMVNRKKCIKVQGKMVALSSIRGQYVKSD